MTENAKLFESAFVNERSKIYGFIRKFIPSKEEAEDILQDVFYQFITYEDAGLIDKIGSWLYITAKNKIIDSRRKKRTDSFTDSFVFIDDEEDNFSLEDFLPSLEINPEDLFISDEFSSRFYSALDELPPEQKDVFILHEIDELSFKEISELTGSSVNTLLSRKHYAVKQLKKKLDKYLHG